MKKILYIVNIAKRINNFSESAMIAALELGMEFHIAGNFSEYKDSDRERKLDEEKYGIHIHQVDFIRKPYHPRNIKAYKQVVDLIEKEDIDVIHCNTPIGGVVGRLAGKKCNVKTVIYQAHGFHFYKGAPLINWMLYYPIEKWLARYTDILITINKEDYVLAKRKFTLRNKGEVKYVPGVGIKISNGITDVSIFSPMRDDLCLSDDDIVMISMGDLIKRKNYEPIIRAIKEINNHKIHYLICGEGEDEKRLKNICKDLDIENQVHLLGYRKDIPDLLKCSDIFINSSLQEGLPRSTMEAMAYGLPVIASKIRGNTDLIVDGRGGILCDDSDMNEYVNAINKLVDDKDLRQTMGKYNLERLRKFDFDTASEKVKEIYKSIAIMGGYSNLRKMYRNRLNLEQDTQILISVGELNRNKNNKVIIDALSRISDKKIHYVLVGAGNEELELRKLVKDYDMESRIHFLGFRSDVKQLLYMSDVFVLPSIREGLSRSLMEAMECGLPCIVSDIRGNRDLIYEKKYRCNVNSIEDWTSKISKVCELSIDELSEIGDSNKQQLSMYSFDKVVKELKYIYQFV